MVDSNRLVIKKSELFVILYILHIIRYYYFIPYSSLNNIAYAIDILFAAYFIFCFFIDKNKFGPNKLGIATATLYILFLCSIPIGLKNGQQVDRVLKASSMMFLQFGFYYYLKKSKLSTSFLLKFLKYLLIGYVLVTILCYLMYPNIIFGGLDEQSLARMRASMEDRGTLRITLPCKMLVPFFLLYAVQNFKSFAESGAKILILLILLLFIGNRFPLVVAIFISIYMILKSSKISYSGKVKMMASVGVIFVTLMVIPVTRNIVNSLFLMTIEENSTGSENNIRYISATYFFTEFNEGNSQAIYIGNGIPSNGPDKYSQRIKNLNEDKGFWESDVGYCEIYIYFGIIGLLALAYWCFEVYRIRIEDKYKFIKYYILFLMIAMICGGYWFENLYIVCMLIYILVNSNKKVLITEKYE